ncbi:MAG: RdgB/HAM1 family non-canonical purine NTP pyrophosphatase [bacterium]
MKLILASHNQDKLREIREILADTAIEVIPQREAGVEGEAVEDGETFLENARIKARYACERTGCPAVSDDSGIIIDAFGGKPGVHSARFLPELDYPAKCAWILAHVGADAPRTARYACAVVVAFPDGSELSAYATTEGSIDYSARGTGGFGYDPIFRVENSEKTMAELTEAEKNAISHRGRAFRQIAEKLKEKGVSSC